MGAERGSRGGRSLGPRRRSPDPAGCVAARGRSALLNGSGPALEFLDLRLLALIHSTLGLSSLLELPDSLLLVDIEGCASNS